MKERVETFLKEFEWTWTIAVLASLGLTTMMLMTAVIVPSFITYFAEQKLGWAGPTDLESTIKTIGHPFAGEISLLHPVRSLQNLNPELGKEIRDAIAMGVTTVAFALPFVVGTILQNKRRKLRGASASRPTGGYR